MMSTILEARDLYKIYQTAAGEVMALQGVNLSIEKGMSYTIIGKSGSGKSTLLHVLSGLDKPTQGCVMVDGKELGKYSDEEMAIFRRRHMGFVFQQYNLLEDYDILTNICMPLTLDGKQADERFLKEITEELGLADKLQKYPSELSGGEQQRAAIARSILAKPFLIFCDEPTGNLDKKTSEHTMKLLNQLTKRFGQTLIMVTHDLEIAQNADVVIQIEDGKIVM